MSAPVTSGAHPNIVQAAASWRAKPSVRAVYGSFYKEILRRAPKGGRLLEIGAGSGHSRDFFQRRDVVRLDVLRAPWVDIVADAHNIPLKDESIDAIVMLDVLHHLADPPKFFQEVERLLRVGGRFIMIEPGVTPFSGFMYRRFHEEPVIMSVDPMRRQEYGTEKDPFESNQAIPTLLFTRDVYLKEFTRRFPNLSIVETRWMSLLAYPLTGGFQSWSFLNDATARALLSVEAVLEPFLGPLMAFRLLVNLEKRRAPNWS